MFQSKTNTLFFISNIPKQTILYLIRLTNMLLAEFPAIRQDKGMMQAYIFLIDFLETVSKESSSMLKQNQKLLRSLLEAAKISEGFLNDFISENKESVSSLSKYILLIVWWLYVTYTISRLSLQLQLLKSDFSVYLDTQIENAESNSAVENMMVTIKLRLLDECGKTYVVNS